jgi:hypothetical protein
VYGLERLGTNRHYNVVFHMGSTYMPVGEETLEELKAQSRLPAERFLDFLINRVGHSSYLKDQIRAALQSSGDPVTQITTLQVADTGAPLRSQLEEFTRQ